jgi:hypothetical protein
MFDDNGYPSEESLELIKNWPSSDFEGLMVFVYTLWNYNKYWKQKGNTYRISTCGWSGNEDIICALMDNRIFWMLCWESSKRGGHYVFKVKNYVG